LDVDSLALAVGLELVVDEGAFLDGFEEGAGWRGGYGRTPSTE
jgi:hypothetical protein